MMALIPTVRARLRTVKRATAPWRLGLARRGERRAVLIVSGPGGFGRLYRGDHRAEQLRAAGLTTDACYRTDVQLEALAPRYRCIVLYRVEWDDEIAALVVGAPASGCSVVCDFDDLVFDPARAHLLRGIDALDDTARTWAVDSMARQRRTLEACGATTVSTEPLAAEASASGVGVAVVGNAISTEMVSRAAVAGEMMAARPDRLRVGYLSGTPTHEADFSEVADELLRVLDRHPHVELVVAGFLDLDPRFDRRRVVREAYRPPAELPALIATLDVNLAPLERDNAFTDCKSCIKYLEAGVVGVPTIASARPDFVRAIRHGENGLLADAPDEWRDALELIVDDRDLRRRIGDAAREDVLERHTTHATAEAAASALERLVPNLR